MPLTASLYIQVRGFAVAPEDIQISDGDSIEVTLSRDGAITKVPISRKTATVTIRGLTRQQARAFVREAERNRSSMLSGSVPGEDLDLGSIEIELAVLVKATPSVPIQVGSGFLVETTQLEFESQKFT